MSTQTNHAHWQLALNQQNYPGQQVVGVDDINQCLAIILNTPLGSDPLRPLFGCDMLPYLDQPENIAIPNLMRVSARAIGLWEPRIILDSVIPEHRGDGHWALLMTWRFKQGREVSYRTEVVYAA